MRSLVVTVLLASSSLARAQGDTSAEDHAKADQIFSEAQQLKQAGKSAEACAKYDEALTYNRNAVGTLLNVALCNEEAGRVATALKHYTNARDIAREHSLAEHRAAAEERIAKIEGLVPHLAIAFAEVAPNMKLVIDDVVYPTTATDIRLDPGSRHIVVTAPGRVPYETTVVLKAQESKAIAIPKLGLPVTIKRTRRTVGAVVGLSGVGIIGAGVVLGFVADSRYNAQFPEHCMESPSGGPPACDAQGYERTGSARTLGTIGTYVGIAGGAALAVGAYLYLFAPKEQAPGEVNVSFVPSISADGASVSAVARF